MTEENSAKQENETTALQWALRALRAVMDTQFKLSNSGNSSIEGTL